MEQNLFSGTLGLIIMAIMLVAAILWFFLPFAVFGTKPKIDELIQINKKTSALLESINAEIIELREATNSQNKPLSNSSVNHEQT